MPPEALAPPAVPMPPAPPTPPARGKRFPEQEKISDPERMKALAHPARMAVFDFLGTRRVQGFDGATATEIADVAGMTPSAMSYHLRTLAKAGFIEEAPSRGDARERVWRLKLHSFSISAEENASEGDLIIERAMGQTFTDQQERNFQRWLDLRLEMDPKYRDASVTSQGRLRLTMEEAREFIRRFHELENEYGEITRERAEKGVDVDDGAEVFNYLFRLFPHLDQRAASPDEKAADPDREV
ncbi:Helix-turn-helix domain-containing protein [Glycomyces harbinensis]|uniref:Helix-turn-helix domain-containing protein n=1 Tax=Glycomyces harbinensis TaxID=58114 RepID=A0A1G6VPL3_9ACTN|nr:Helix-turn-helix domain-containing protein [Glycomyces harbinensis]